MPACWGDVKCWGRSASGGSPLPPRVDCTCFPQPGAWPTCLTLTGGPRHWGNHCERRIRTGRLTLEETELLQEGKGHLKQF